jgi:cytochrome c oxidase subunit 3
MSVSHVTEGHHNPALQHQFEDLEQQHETYNLGMWTFLVTEVMFFGGLFTVYAIYRALYPVGFAEASNHLNLLLSTVNTAILLCSSLAMALAVRAAQMGNKRAIINFLALTIVLAVAFLGLKGVEYYAEYRENLIPGLNFAFEGAHATEVQLFFVLYFVMTGLHATHMVIGIVVMAIMIFYASRDRFTADSYEPVEMTGLYWHFVDLVWVFLFPLIYLIARHG